MNQTGFMLQCGSSEELHGASVLAAKEADFIKVRITVKHGNISISSFRPMDCLAEFALPLPLLNQKIFMHWSNPIRLLCIHQPIMVRIGKKKAQLKMLRQDLFISPYYWLTLLMQKGFTAQHLIYLEA